MITEDAFAADVVGPLLREEFGADAVERERYLETTGSFADYWVDTGLVTLAIEVENDADAIRDGVAQALTYAQHDVRALPVVITPTGAVDRDEVALLRTICPVIELDS